MMFFTTACLFNICILIVFIFKMERSSSFNILTCIAFNDFVCRSFYVSLLVIYISGFNNDDFVPVHMVRLILIGTQVVIQISHAYSTYLILGVLLHRYLLLSSPLTFKSEVDKNSYLIRYCLFALIVCVSPFVPLMVRFMNLQVIEVASKLDHSQVIETVLNTPGNDVSTSLNFIVAIIALKVVPVLICVGLEIKCVRLVRQLKNKRQHLTTRRKGNNMYQSLNRTFLTMVSSHLLAEVPYIFILLLFILTKSTDIKTIVFTAQVVSFCSYLLMMSSMFLSGTLFREAFKQLFFPCCHSSIVVKQADNVCPKKKDLSVLAVISE